MSSSRHILRALHIASIWLVALSALAGPLGVGVSAASTVCISCDCEDDTAQAEAEGTGDGAQESEERDDGESCPPDCTHCSCCAGLTVGLQTMSVTGLRGSAPVAAPDATPDAPPLGTSSGVFRPPRSLT